MLCMVENRARHVRARTTVHPTQFTFLTPHIRTLGVGTSSLPTIVFRIDGTLGGLLVLR